MEGNMITIANLPDHILERYETRGKTPALRGMEKTHILNVLKETGGDRAKAAEILGIDKTTLWRKIKRYGIE